MLYDVAGYGMTAFGHNPGKAPDHSPDHSFDNFSSAWHSSGSVPVNTHQTRNKEVEGGPGHIHVMMCSESVGLVQ